jgi:hypothetical protein
MHSRIGVRSNKGRTNDEVLHFVVIVDVLEGIRGAVEVGTVVINVEDLAQAIDHGIQIVRISEEVYSHTCTVSGIVGVKLNKATRTRSQDVEQTEDVRAIGDSKGLDIRTGIVGVLELGTKEEMTFVESVGITVCIGTDDVDLGDWVILKVSAYTGKILHERNSEGLQLGGITNTRETKDLRGTDGSHAHDDLLGGFGCVSLTNVVIDPSNTSGTLGRIEVDAKSKGTIHDKEVGTTEVGSNEGLVGILSNTINFGSLLESKVSKWVIDLFGSIPVGDVIDSSGGCGLNDLGIPRLTSTGHTKWA